MSDDGCLFCGIVAGDIPAEIIDSDEHTVAFMDIAPATPGHALVIPRNHSDDLLVTPPEDVAHAFTAAQRLARHMEGILGADGFNLINSCRPAAWQTVFHLHVHVVPRYEDDPLRLPWQPHQGDSEEIAAIAAKLRRT